MRRAVQDQGILDDPPATGRHANWKGMIDGGLDYDPVAGGVRAWIAAAGREHSGGGDHPVTGDPPGMPALEPCRGRREVGVRFAHVAEDAVLHPLANGIHYFRRGRENPCRLPREAEGPSAR